MFTRRLRTGAAEIGREHGSDNPSRRQDRGWGPFSGRQLTGIIVTLAALVMVPGTAYAVATFTNVAIQDPVTGARASVDATHHLQVGDGTGPLTVDGSLNARPSAPTLPFHFSEDTDSTHFTAWIGPSSVQIDLTNLTIALKAGTGTGADIFMYEFGATPDGTACDLTNGGFLSTVYHIPNVSNAAPVVMSFPTPLVVKPAPGHKICLVGFAGGGPIAVANGSGFFG
jgi:hypothetical protein